MFLWERWTRHRTPCRTPEDAMSDCFFSKRRTCAHAMDHLSAIKPNCCAMRINCKALLAPNFCLIDDW